MTAIQIVLICYVFPVAAMLLAVYFMHLRSPRYRGRHVRNDGVTIFQPEPHSNCRCVVTPVIDESVDRFIRTGDVRDLFAPERAELES